ncbi:inner membrane transport protein [Salmonella enterica subsp. arizonae]|uniref:Inner membrane transport protein n=1 Tax=Salmonella enterica subsp. arizonae TaxID=59203 RepID=A0A379SJY9_SALER|nr:inner membrane transport protein [Salmonella enterica subsp. arizonae]
MVDGNVIDVPHAVLHSAALSFLGFGLAPHEPSLGLLLADALRFISHGNWWLGAVSGANVIHAGYALRSVRARRSAAVAKE